MNPEEGFDQSGDIEEVGFFAHGGVTDVGAMHHTVVVISSDGDDKSFVGLGEVSLIPDHDGEKILFERGFVFDFDFNAVKFHDGISFRGVFKIVVLKGFGKYFYEWFCSRCVLVLR